MLLQLTVRLQGRRSESPTYWCMSSLVIDVHKRSFDVGQYLDFVLELLADIMRFPQRRASIHDYVDLDKVVLLMVS